jgi:hypothetical protein
MANAADAPRLSGKKPNGNYYGKSAANFLHSRVDTGLKRFCARGDYCPRCTIQDYERRGR